MSKGENRIVDLLNAAGLKYIREKTFSDLKHGTFRYDFYVYTARGPVLIEYNGEQHYQFVKKFYRTANDWRKMQEHDRRKLSYALANKIPIYVIPYWELGNLRESGDIFNEKFLASSRWKNDDDFRIFSHGKQ